MRLLATLFSNAALAGLAGVVGVVAILRIYGADLPDRGALVNYSPPVISRVYSPEGAVIGEFARQRRVFAPIEEIPQLVRDAFISAEDKNFYAHSGVDPLGMVKAVARYAIARVEGREAQLAGASTITQQVMKNFLLDNERAIERKIREMILATRIDGALSKDRILELYLNDIYLGAGAYGVAAAAKTYFNKGLDELTPVEAAYLAALPKKPSELHPVRDHDAALARRNYVLREMAQNRHLAPEEAAVSMTLPLDTVLDDPAVPVAARPGLDYFTAEIRRRLGERVGIDRLYEDGLIIRATLDAELQALAGRALRRRLVQFDRERGLWRGPAAHVADLDPGGWSAALAGVAVPRDIAGWRPAVVLGIEGRDARIGVEGEADPARLTPAGMSWVDRARRDGQTRAAETPAGMLRPGDVILVEREDAGWALRQVPELQGAFMAMDPHTGRVLALQGGFSYEHSAFNRATQARRQPGSAFKPFVYAAALDAGYSPSTVVLDAPVVVRLAGGDWRPKNSSGGFYGPTPLNLGIVHSRNLMTVRIAQTIGMERVADYAERFGVYEDMPKHLSYALGAGETTLWDMVAAYGMFANGGKRVRPSLIDRIQNRRGETVFRHDPRHCVGCDARDPGVVPRLYDSRGQIMNAVTARQLVGMMEGVVQYGTAARTVGDLGFALAGKTGTSNESRDAWFVGFAPNLVAGCYIGYDTPRPMGRGAYGGTLCGPVFREFMAEAMETRAPGRFPEPDGAATVMVKIDRETGARLPDDATGPNVTQQVFRAGTEPDFYESGEALVADAALFGGSAETLPYEITTTGARPVTGAPGDGAGAERPASPAPPSDIGLDSGGLY